MNMTHKILREHLLGGDMTPGQEINLRVDQTLTQDATGTMAWLQFEALGLPRVRTELSVSYVDHNTLQMGFRNPDDHRFLRTAAARFGAVYSPPGAGICHQLHLENFARPGRILLGSDSHTPMAGGMGCLAMGAGGLSVALAMAGEPYSIPMPRVVEVRLTGRLKGWAQAKDVILHLLGHLTTQGGVGRVFEYTGPGVETLSVPERATIANMGAELGATASVFPSDERTREFLRRMGREESWQPLGPDAGSRYDETLEIDLSSLVPLVARPHMPDRVLSVAELAAEEPGLHVDQVAIGSCTNSSYADLCLVAAVLRGRRVEPSTDVCVSPGSRQVLGMLAAGGALNELLDAGVRLLECSCGPCIGMGSSPVSAGVSVRTFNRNFEGRSGTRDAGVYLVSPATAAQCALRGCFSDPETWGEAPARADFPEHVPDGRHHFIFPPADSAVEIVRGPNIVPLEQFPPLESQVDGVVTLKVGDGITTDHIMPAGAEITALRSNVPAIARYVFSRVDPDFVRRTETVRNSGRAGMIVAGQNYGQGSSREHAALAPRHLGIRAVLAQSFARIHRANLINFGILPLIFVDPADYTRVPSDARISFSTGNLTPGGETVMNVEGVGAIRVRNDWSSKEWRILQAGGLLNDVRARRSKA